MLNLEARCAGVDGCMVFNPFVPGVHLEMSSGPMLFLKKYLEWRIKFQNI